MRILLWVIFSLTAALFALGVKAGSPAMVVADLVGGVTMFIIVAKCMEVARRRRGVFVLQCIDHSLRLNAPLPEMLRAAAQNESGRTQDVLREIANYIEVGMTIGDALEQAWAGLTPRTLRLIRAAEQGGRLQPQIARIVEEERQAARVESIDSILMLIYPVILVVSLAGLFGAVTIFIMPKYARIFEDFDAQLPELTLWFVREATPYGSVLLAAAGLLGIGLLVKAATDASDRSSFSLRLPWRDWLAWHLPVWRAGERPRAFRDAFALMADVLDSGEPLPGAVGRAVSASSNGSLRRRLRQWQAGIESGMSVDAAAGEANLPKIVVGMISTGAAAGNLGEVMRFLARYYGGRFSRVATLVRGMVMPFVVIVLATMIGAFVVAMFLPLVDLIQSVAGSAI